jgi:CO/xanthine dehydrogenase Mo-binding subunit
MNHGRPIVYEQGNFPEILRRAIETTGWSQLRETMAVRNAGDAAVRFGVGLACVTELSRFGPFETAKVEVTPTGRVHVYTGAASLGQGHETTLAQVCADALDVPFDEITVHHGDTSHLPYGMGTWGCRFGVAAAAVHEAASQVRANVLKASAAVLEVSESDLVLKDGRVSVVGMPERGCTLRELSRALSPSAFGPGGTDWATKLQALHYFKVQQPAVSFSVHIAVVAVDTRTGVVSPQRYLLVCDVGRMVNPAIVEGQLVGGAVQGIGGALCEDLVYDANAQLLTATLMDYALLTASGVPTIEVTAYESEAAAPGMSGVHGVGEMATAGAGAAVASAVADALRGRAAPLTALPLRPEIVMTLLEREADR